MTTISILDLGLGVLILLFLVRGLLRGIIGELAGLVALFLGLFLAGRFYPLLMPQFAGIIESQKVVAGLSYGVILSLTLTVVGLCVMVIKRFLPLALPTWLDSILGAVIGSVKGLFVCALILALMQRFVPDSPFLKNAVMPGHIDAVIAFARSLLPAFLDAAGRLV